MSSLNRRTITIDSDIEAKLRDIQAQLIQATSKNWSLSSVANLILLSGILSPEKLTNADWNFIAQFVNNEKVDLKNKNIKKYITRLSKKTK